MKGPDGEHGAWGQEPWYVCVDVGTGVFVMAQGGQFVLILRFAPSENLMK